MHPLAPQQKPAPHFQKLPSNISVPASLGLVDFFGAGYLYIEFFKEGKRTQINRVSKWKPATLFYMLLEKILM